MIITESLAIESENQLIFREMLLTQKTCHMLEYGAYDFLMENVYLYTNVK